MFRYLSLECKYKIFSVKPINDDDDDDEDGILSNYFKNVSAGRKEILLSDIFQKGRKSVGTKVPIMKKKEKVPKLYQVKIHSEVCKR